MAAELLKAAGASVGDEVEVVKDGKAYRGFLMARYEYGEADVIVLKLGNGYNIGVRAVPGTRVVKLTASSQPSFKPPPPPPPRPGLPHVAVVGTGGTIASRIDYRTGGVRAAMTAADLVSIFPEIAEVANVSAEVLMQVYSENLTPSHWTKMAEEIDRLLREGVDGIVVAHGTDTMGYSSAALSFALQKPPKPVVLVGAQRSSDRPSSDAATNLIAAVETASKAPFAEVVVCMHAWHGDDMIYIHRGTRVVKMHTSSRSAFQSVNTRPLAVKTAEGFKIIASDFHRRDEDGYVFSPNFDEHAMLLKFFPGMRPETLTIMVEKLGLRGVILEGTGLGHVASSFVPVIKELTDMGVFIGMTSQCRFGRVNMKVYDNGRDLMRAGAVPLDDMLPETALVKLMWVLGRVGGKPEPMEVKSLMLRNICGEIGERVLPQQPPS